LGELLEFVQGELRKEALNSRRVLDWVKLGSGSLNVAQELML